MSESERPLTTYWPDMPGTPRQTAYTRRADTWPTHRRRRPQRSTTEPQPRQLTTGEMARDLVARGLASSMILDSQPTTYDNRKKAA